MLTKCFNAVGRESCGRGSILGCIRSTPPSPSVEWGEGTIGHLRTAHTDLLIY